MTTFGFALAVEHAPGARLPNGDPSGTGGATRYAVVATVDGGHGQIVATFRSDREARARLDALTALTQPASRVAATEDPRVDTDSATGVVGRQRASEAVIRSVPPSGAPDAPPAPDAPEASAHQTASISGEVVSARQDEG